MMGLDEHEQQPPGERTRAPRVARLMDASAGVAEAYRHCEALTRTRAGNFYYGIRLLPAPKRRAMCAVYAFARRVDDIGDGELAPEQKLRELEQQAGALEALTLAAGAPAGAPAAAPRESRGRAPLALADAADPVMLALADATPRFALPVDALGELIEGVRMDVEGHTYERFEDLLLYCRRVAGAIGRLCLAVFDVRAAYAPAAAHAQALADDLGVAMQLTNILRDVREDAENGRVYLPAEDLRRFGLLAAVGEPGESAPLALASLAQGASLGGARANGDGIAPGANGTPEAGGSTSASELAALVRFEAERAREWFDRGVTLAGLLDRRSAACVLAMAGIYERLLERIAADPEQAIAHRVTLPAWEKAWVAAGSMLGSDARVRRGRSAAGVAIGGRG
jgi:15-cis-phytoene synthase